MSAARVFTLQSRLFNSKLYSRLLQLWFSDLPLSAPAPSKELNGRWFGVGVSSQAKSAFDGECISTALPALESISAENYPLPPFTGINQDHHNYSEIAEPFVEQFTKPNAKEENDEAALGLILLLDQMPRNVFRSQQDVIYKHYDRISRAVAFAIYSKGLDVSEKYRDSPPWQSWFYLPLEHSESVSDHQLMDQKLEAMKFRMQSRAEKAGVDHVSTLVGFEKKHRSIIDQFGRYPHRNPVLEREHTDEEKAYLASGGDTFGTS
ncbi:MAG: hypothetical protein Q9220_001203 [cf. Caloplaca sp. 1 TL-2023]